MPPDLESLRRRQSGLEQGTRAHPVRALLGREADLQAGLRHVSEESIGGHR